MNVDQELIAELETPDLVSLIQDIDLDFLEENEVLTEDTCNVLNAALDDLSRYGEVKYVSISDLREAVSDVVRVLG